MGSSPVSRLSPLQRDVLREFFVRERGYFLTGGGALAGFHLGHRTTDDLELFTTDDAAFERRKYVLEDIARDLGGRIEIRQDTPRFMRAVLTRGDEGVVIDLVRDTDGGSSEKQDHEGVIVEEASSILVNKLTTLVGRAEERDLVDLLFLERAGFRIEDALPAALAKDGGCTPATLAWLLSEIRIPDGAVLPAQVTPAELRVFVDDLIVRLRAAALPKR